MTDVVVRQIHTDDEILNDFSPIGNYAFGSTPPMETEEKRRENLPYNRERRIVVSYENGHPRATAAALSMTQNVRGTVFQMGAISPVAAHPMGRRKGYARMALTHLLGILREEGHAFTGLYPFRESFYQRLGYVTYPRVKKIDVDTANLSTLSKQEIDDIVEMMPVSEGQAILDAFLAQMQAKTHGMALFKGENAKRIATKNEQWLTVARYDGQVEGLMLYKISGYGGTMEIPWFLTLSTRARYALLSYVARHVDQIKTVTISLRHDERPQTWLTDMLPRSNPDIWLTAMGRVLDVARIGGMHVGPGSAVLAIHDKQCDWNNGTWTFRSEDGKLVVEPTEAPADGDLSIQGLSALAYGTHDPHDFAIRGWGTLSDDLADTLDGMFPQQSPHMFSAY